MDTEIGIEEEIHESFKNNNEDDHALAGALRNECGWTWHCTCSARCTGGDSVVCCLYRALPWPFAWLWPRGFLQAVEYEVFILFAKLHKKDLI
jgi:hypothetical protein